MVHPPTAEGCRAAARQVPLGLRARGDAVAGQRLCTGTQMEEGRGTQGVSSPISVVLCGSGFSLIGLVSVWFWIKTAVSVSISKPSQHYF